MRCFLVLFMDWAKILDLFTEVVGRKKRSKK